MGLAMASTKCPNKTASAASRFTLLPLNTNTSLALTLLQSPAADTYEATPGDKKPPAGFAYMLSSSILGDDPERRGLERPAALSFSPAPAPALRTASTSGVSGLKGTEVEAGSGSGADAEADSVALSEAEDGPGVTGLKLLDAVRDNDSTEDARLLPTRNDDIFSIFVLPTAVSEPWLFSSITFNLLYASSSLDNKASIV
jgi:hypothetical protein